MNIKTGLKIFLPLLGVCALLAGIFIASNAVALFGSDKTPSPGTGTESGSDKLPAPGTDAEFESDKLPAPETGAEFESDTLSAPETGAEFESDKVIAIEPNLAATSVMTKDEVADWIRKQGKDQHDYYFDGLFVEEVNLDQDEELEVLARIDGGVHLGDFFIFDQQADGSYKLIYEQPWHVISWEIEYYQAAQMNPFFTIITRTGGTGMDVREAHLMYMNDAGAWTEAWTGTLKDRSIFQDIYYITMGSYQFNDDNGELYYWQTELNTSLEEDKLVDGPKTTMEIFELQQGRFIVKK